MSMYTRRTFIKQLVLTGGFLVAGGKATRVFARDTQIRALEMLTLGDSVVWGQGLMPEHKFSYLIRDWLKAESGREVNFHNEAHSGATIYPESDEKKKYKFYGREIKDGEEINVSLPSIFRQLKDSVEFYKNRGAADGGKLTPEAVDLILLDGGINDVHALKIVLSSPDDIRKRAEKFCYKGMKELLTEVIKNYSNARIVVTGYFPLISMDSNPTEIQDGVFALLGENKPQELAAELTKKFLKILPKDWHQFHKALAERSDTWYEKSNEYLSRAVAEINSVEKSTSFSAVNPRVLFTAVPFSSKNAYAVDDSTLLWRIKAKIKTDDEMFEARKKICEAVNNKLFGELTCHRAAAFHPNIKGTQEYAAAIKNKLAPILDATGWKK
jgi:lysophospholipase L1-like esterase